MKKISWDSMAESLSDDERIFQRRVQEARSEAITYLGLAKKPSGKVFDRLLNEGFDEAVIREVINELKAEGYLDDAVIVKRIIRQRQGRQAESKLALRHRMISNGLDPEIVDVVLGKSDSDLARAQDLLHSRFPTEYTIFQSNDLKREERHKLFLKLAQFLSRRGFEHSIIDRVLNRRDPD